MKREFGMKLERSHDQDIINREVNRGLDEGRRLKELGDRFVQDKEKLEAEIAKVQESNISENDKKRLIAGLNNAIDALTVQYEQDVTEAERNVQEEISSQLESMQEAAEEHEKLAESFRTVKMEAAEKDATEAASDAERQKKIFETMKYDYAEKSRLLHQQAAEQARRIRTRTLTGK